jgi:hypothetical protein
MKMKTAIFVIAIMVGSLFAAGLALAYDPSGPNQVEVEEARKTSMILKTESEGKPVDFEMDMERRLGPWMPDSRYREFPSREMHGRGWIYDDKNGHFMEIKLLSKSYENQMEVIRGRIKIDDGRTLFVEGRKDIHPDTPIDFILYSDEGKTLGKLHMYKEEGLDNGFSSWSGRIDLNEGNSFALKMAIMERRSVKPESAGFGEKKEVYPEERWPEKEYERDRYEKDLDSERRPEVEGNYVQDRYIERRSESIGDSDKIRDADFIRRIFSLFRR